MVAMLDKHTEQIKESYRVKISANSTNAEDSVMYMISQDIKIVYKMYLLQST